MRISKTLKAEQGLIDKFMVVTGIVGPLSVLPQAISIYSARDAGSVSFLSWLSFSLLSFIGILYALVHGDKVILIGYSLYFVVDVLVLIGVVVYG